MHTYLFNPVFPLRFVVEALVVGSLPLPPLGVREHALVLHQGMNVLGLEGPELSAVVNLAIELGLLGVRLACLYIPHALHALKQQALVLVALVLLGSRGLALAVREGRDAPHRDLWISERFVEYVALVVLQSVARRGVELKLEYIPGRKLFYAVDAL